MALPYPWKDSDDPFDESSADSDRGFSVLQVYVYHSEVHF